MRAFLSPKREDVPFIILHSVLKHALKSLPVISAVVVLTSDLSPNSRWNVIYNNTPYPPPPRPSAPKLKVFSDPGHCELGSPIKKKVLKAFSLCIYGALSSKHTMENCSKWYLCSIPWHFSHLYVVTLQNSSLSTWPLAHFRMIHLTVQKWVKVGEAGVRLTVCLAEEKACIGLSLQGGKKSQQLVHSSSCTQAIVSIGVQIPTQGSSPVLLYEFLFLASLSAAFLYYYKRWTMQSYEELLQCETTEISGFRLR